MPEVTKPIRIAIASDQSIYLRGLETLIMGMHELQLVGEARSCPEILQLCEMTHPEVTLLDLKHAREHDAVGMLHQKHPHMKVVLLEELREESNGLEESENRPLYIFSRDVTDDEFKVALRQVIRDPASKEELARASHPVFPHQAANDPEEQDHHDLDRERRMFQPRSEEILTRELVMAGKIQTDILPEEVPYIKGWDLSAVLLPARETSGDFYDFIPLLYQKWGIVVADVTDKGMGAALFMALSSTLIRTYAIRYPTLPALTMSAVNERILNDTRGSMFVTAFFGILEPHTGRLIFSNAGHPPGFVLSVQRGKPAVEYLRPTGMALGVSETASWKQKSVRLSPGDVLVLYTDGVTEAENPKGEFFKEDNLLDVVLDHADKCAGDISKALLDEVQRFTGGSVRQDDIALIVIKRDR